MGYKTLYEALPFLKDVDKDRQEQFKEYFKGAPLWLLDSFQIEEMDKNVIFVRENAPVDNIYFIGKGTIEAIDYRFHMSLCALIKYMPWVEWNLLWIWTDTVRHCEQLRNAQS